MLIQLENISRQMEDAVREAVCGAESTEEIEVRLKNLLPAASIRVTQYGWNSATVTIKPFPQACSEWTMTAER